MAELEKNPPRRTCAQCGAELPGNAPGAFCPKCLLKAAMEPAPAGGPTGTVALSPQETPFRGLPQPGEQLGHYHIARLLGRGGMGAVFEAEDVETGRHVALKVLSQVLDSPQARERFFREGRLAASINHPNSVYVFGTEEIAGTPVIAMELVPGGTLQDRVKSQGPLPTGEAVDAVLQLIAGLEAAQRIGILHRDVKPSNCFRDVDGTVKIGDFGLSISTAVRTEPALTATGVFLGTPAFCSPEQLRGDELNARSDIYSVGATLFYLLTGRAPFEGKNVVQLLATVIESQAPSPRKLRQSIPRGLAWAVQHCLQKQPTERFKNYQELAEALAPYSSAAPTPATLGLRFVAGMVDFAVLSIVGTSVQMIIFGDLGAAMDYWMKPRSPGIAWAMASGLGLGLLYYAVMDGVWGATVGKRICRLLVVGPDHGPPGLGQGLIRALVYMLLPPMPYWIAVGGNISRFATFSPWVGFSYYILLALLFCTARRRNGFAALQDLLSSSRVVSRTALQARPALAVSETAPAALETKPQIGPYHVLEPLGKTTEAEWLLGYDIRLLRKVWIRVVPTGTPPIPASWRNIGRPGRLRWLTGCRSFEQNWDAFEAVGGRPLAELTRAPQPWGHVRFWLYDLANEIAAAARDGTSPATLALDRVWITGEGRAKLLDFPAPGLDLSTARVDSTPLPTTSEAEAAPPRLATPDQARQFLAEVAAAALAGSHKMPAEVGVPLPLHARAFLKSLAQMGNPETISAALRPLLSRATGVSRWRRLAIIAGCVALPLIEVPMFHLGTSMMERWNQIYPGLMDLSTLLQQHSTMRTTRSLFGKAVGKANVPTDEQFSIYISSHYRSLITNQETWSSPIALILIKGAARNFAEKSVAEHPAPAREEVAQAEVALKPFTNIPSFPDMTKRPMFPFTIANATLLIYVIVPALIAALCCRGGLVLRLANVTFVRRDGTRASRLRIFWRAIVSWGAVLAALFLAPRLFPGQVRGALLGYAVALLLAALYVAMPGRGLADRLAGTWQVPR